MLKCYSLCWDDVWPNLTPTIQVFVPVISNALGNPRHRLPNLRMVSLGTKLLFSRFFPVAFLVVLLRDLSRGENVTSIWVIKRSLGRSWLRYFWTPQSENMTVYFLQGFILVPTNSIKNWMGPYQQTSCNRAIKYTQVWSFQGFGPFVGDFWRKNWPTPNSMHFQKSQKKTGYI